MKKIRLAIFVYNFPHKKSQDFLLRLFVDGFKVECAIAADPIKLNIPPSSVRTKIRHGALLHPREVAESIGVPYYVIPHNSEQLFDLLKSLDLDIGIIAGARILKKDIISAFRIGIINFHPGLIPEARGLDALLWSIYNDIPLGVTAHLIDEFVDAGIVLIKKEIPIYKDDTIFDLSERLYDTQLELLKPAIKLAVDKKNIAVINHDRPFNRKMPRELEEITIDLVRNYVIKHSSD